MRLAVAGVGNNIPALVQGIGFYRQLDDEEELPGMAQPVLGGLRVTDIDVVAAFDVSETKAGRPLSEAIFAAPNNYPVLGAPQMTEDPEVLPGIADPDDEQQLTSVTKILRELDVEVLLYSLPTGLPEVARAYGRAAIAAGRCRQLHARPGRGPARPAGRGAGSRRPAGRRRPAEPPRQLHSPRGAAGPAGGARPHAQRLLPGQHGRQRRLRQPAQARRHKEASEHRALRQKVSRTDRVTVIPSAGFVSHLGDRKVAHLSIEARGWADMPVKLDVTLQVQDSSNAAGVIIDLIGIAAIARRRGETGFPVAATTLLKSPTLVEDPLRQGDHALELLAVLAAENAD
ncbi:Inositol-3-phosphate synthase OS=Streptomyces fumanus OX=67302 GN=GCM10018772_38550 PE=3 SV=1 [Streptomyces fumanus]